MGTGGAGLWLGLCGSWGFMGQFILLDGSNTIQCSPLSTGFIFKIVLLGWSM